MRWIPCAVAIACAACDDGSPTRPSAPARSPLVVEGRVQDTAFRPIGGAVVAIVDGPAGGTSAATDATGRYSLSAAHADTISLQASSQRHLPATITLTPRAGHVGGYSVWFTLTPAAPSLNLTGEYTLTFTADAACTLPDIARRRTYAASIRPRTSWTIANQYDVTLGGATFYPASERMYAATAENFARFEIDDEFGNAVAEQLSPSTYVSLAGAGGAEFTASGVTVPWSSVFEYCPEAETGRPACRPGPAVCRSANHTLLVERR